MIDTYQELILALSEAAELEHSLICQYLFAAYSMKTARDGLSDELVERFAGWQEQILNVARQEMGHLGTVWNLQALAGAAPCTLRANFPQPGGRYYPPEIDFALTPFSEATLDRFIAFERPEQNLALLQLNPPEPIEYVRVGDLYRQIARAIDAMPDEQVLLNPAATEDSQSWSNNVTLMTATTRRQMIDAIQFIIEQGEGGAGTGGSSHYATFNTIRNELRAHLAANGEAPARAVVANPWTVSHRDAAGGTMIDNPASVRAVAAFNLLYYVLLQLLRHYYGGPAESDGQHSNLRMAAYKLMHNCLGPLGAILTRLPAADAVDGPRAGPSFERYGGDDLADNSIVLRRIAVNQLGIAGAELEALAGTTGIAELNRVVAGVTAAAGWLTADIPA
jgi:Ferritin-like